MDSRSGSRWERYRIAATAIGLFALPGHAVSAGPRDMASTGAPVWFNLKVPSGLYFPNFAPTVPVFRSIMRPPPVLNTSSAFRPMDPGDTSLSSAAARVSFIAAQNGDRNYLMVDKAAGKLTLFENGRPIISRSALTGASLADEFPRDAWSKTWAQQRDVRYKVTPAGRFTLTRSYDRGLGDIFDINELHGKDWVIAIHKAWLGRTYEHRDVRLRSTLGQDKHITDGCVDVDPETIVMLMRLLPSRGMPIYILPVDDNLIPALFQTRSYYGYRPGPES